MMKPRALIQSGIGTALTIALVGGWSVLAAEKPKYTIKEVMKELHKGENALCKKVAKGEGTKDELAKFVEYYSSLPLQEPPKGDAKEWKEKATRLLDATKALRQEKPGALAAFKEAINCKACHSAHKGD